MITIELQKEHLTLSECRFAVDTLIEAIHYERDEIGSSFFGCNLNFDNIKLDGRILLTMNLGRHS